MISSVYLQQANACRAAGPAYPPGTTMMLSRFLQRAPKCARSVHFLSPAFVAPALSSSVRSRAMAEPVSGQRHMATTITVEKPDTTIVFPRENPAAGFSYDLNWSLCGSGVVPQGKSFRNLKSQELAKLGGSKKAAVPQVRPWSSALEQQVVRYLESEKVTRYVQDSALGALLQNEVQVRLVSDSPAAALDFKTWLSTTRAAALESYKENITILQAVDLPTNEAFISYNAKTKTVVIGGSSNFEKLLDFFPQASAEAFLERQTLPLWGSMVGDAIIVSKGLDGKASIKHGCAFSNAGFCRLFMGSISGGNVKDEYKAFPNSLPVPKGVVFFAEDATGTLPGAAKLTAAQAAYLYASAIAPTPGLTSWAKAAKLVLDLGAKTSIYLVNRGAFENAAAAEEAALSVVGKSGSPAALGLEAIDTGKQTKKASSEDAAKTLKGWQTLVEARCKGMDAVLAGAPKP